MQKIAQKLIQKLMNRSDRGSLAALSKLMAVGVPFNAPHGFSFLEISQERVKIFLPNRKLNHNHLGGIHACAIATLGEYCAGMWLSKQFGLSTYRLIMKELTAKYHYQGRKDLVGICEMNEFSQEEVVQAIVEHGKTVVVVTTEIHDVVQNHVATVTTTWQLKSWDKVQTK